MNEIALPADPVSALLTRAATDPNFDAQKFEVAVSFIREREAKQARREFNDAMARAQAVLRSVPRNAKNDHLRSRYATLDGMLAVILPAISNHGLTLRFGSAPASQPGWQCVTCIVTLGDHEEVTALEGPIVTPPTTRDGRTQMTPIQATGSTTTYLKRYLLGMAFALVLTDEQDDDGEAIRRVAAASTPRAERKVDPTVYDAAPKPTPERTDEQWRVWLDKLRAACEVLYHRSEVVEIGERESVGAALATGPQWVQREISAILAENYKRFPAEADDEPDLSDEALGEVQIEGAEKVAAG